jgi:hypothetical protein
MRCSTPDSRPIRSADTPEQAPTGAGVTVI